MEQVAIAMTGITAIWLSQDKRETWRKICVPVWIGGTAILVL